jgi:hypothetical protein
MVVPAEEAFVPHKVIATWAVGTFLENLAIKNDGSIIVSSYFDGVVHRVMPSGATKVIAMFDQPVTGIVVSGDEMFVCSGTAGKSPWRMV